MSSKRKDVNNIRILVIIPAFNEQDNIEKTIQNLNANYPEADYVVINDCSTDHTREILNGNGYNYVDLPVNLGIGGGVQTGFLYAAEYDYDIAIQMDGDGQHNASYIDNLILPIVSGKADMTIGSRYIEKEGFQSSALRRIGINFLSALIKACTGTRIYDVTSGFRAFNRKCIRLFSNEYAQDYPEPEAIVRAVCNGISIAEVPVVMNARTSGSSSIFGLKSIYYMIKVSMAIILLRLTLKRRYN